MRDVLLPVVGTPVIEEVGRPRLPADVQQWPDDWRIDYEERVAILHYDGGQALDFAERMAEQIIRDDYRRYQEQK
jgi:hypothetical protein